MKIEKLKDFKALVKACRQLGVDEASLGEGMYIKLGPMPIKRSNGPTIDQTAFPEASIKVPQYDGPISEPETIPDAGLTEDQLMYYSAQGHDQVEQ